MSTSPTESPGAAVSDGSLLRRFRLGNQDAATELFRRYGPRLRALTREHCPRTLARRVDTEDIVQSVFRRFFQQARWGHYEVPAGEELWGLFLVMALNKIRSQEAFHYAAKRDVRQTEGDPWLDEAPRSPRRQQAQDAAFLELSIKEALERLPPQHRTMVELRIEGYEVAEIAQKVKRSKRSVERILQQARRKLRSLLEE